MKMYRAMGLQDITDGPDSKNLFSAHPRALPPLGSPGKRPAVFPGSARKQPAGLRPRRTYCDWGTRGPVGAGGASLSRTPPRGWLGAGAGCVAPGAASVAAPGAGAAGEPCDGAEAGVSNTDGARSV